MGQVPPRSLAVDCNLAAERSIVALGYSPLAELLPLLRGGDGVLHRTRSRLQRSIWISIGSMIIFLR